MIHDATGKFSSRWVFPDRRSLALVIRNWLHSLGIGGIRRCSAHAKRSRAPYRGIRRQNQCYMGCLAPPVTRVIEPKMAFPRRLTDASAAYRPLFFRTWSQAALILERFSLRQAKMVKSPWSITGRQNFCTSRLQAFCSSGVPLRDCCGCWAKAPDETVSDNKVSARRNLRIVFLHFGSKNPVPRFALRDRRNGSVWMGRRRVTQRRVRT